MRSRRLSARARLTLAFLGLFVALGTVLLAVNYQLLAKNLDNGSKTEVVALKRNGTVNVTEDGKITTSNEKPSELQGVPITANSRNGQVTASSLIKNYRSKALHTLLRISVLSLVSVTLIAGLLVWWVARRTLRPLRSMSAATNRITEKNLDERLPLAEPHDELHELAATFNAMMDRLGAAFAHERRLVANASHELGTPIANQRMALEVALDDPDATAEDLRAACRTALDEAARADRLLRGMLTMARAEQSEIEGTPTRVDEVVADELDSLSTDDLVVERHLAAVEVDADPFLLGRLVHNLLRNATEHNLPGGWIRADLTDSDGAPRLRISNACDPIDPETVSGLTEPFRRGGQDRTGSDRGSGLGLAIAQTIAVAHGWELQVSTDSGTFEVTVDFSAVTD